MRRNTRRKKTVGFKRLFRFFNQEEYVSRFLAGEVRITTLEACRSYESSERGDKGEGTHAHLLAGSISGDGDNARFRAAAQVLGVRVADDPSIRNISFSNVITERKIPDAYLLCLTESIDFEQMEAFGQFAVLVKEPKKLFKRLTKAIKERQRLRTFAMGKVTMVLDHPSISKISLGHSGF